MKLLKKSLENLIRDIMENIVDLKVPLKSSIEFGDNWGEMH